MLDLPARGHVSEPETAKKAQHYRRVAYNLRDCLAAVYMTPDKAKSRTVIHVDHTPQAIEVAYGLMADLRGRLVTTTTSDENVWVISSIDGTDPTSMPADGQPKLVTFLWNDHRVDTTANLTLQAPTGTSFQAGTQTEITLDESTYEFGTKDSAVAASGNSHQLSVTIPARRAVKIVLPLDGKPIEASEVLRHQHFAADVLQDVKRGQNWSTKVTVASEAKASAKRAWLRLVVEQVADGEGLVAVAGKTLTIPKAMTGSNVCRIVEIPLEVADLSDEMPLEFSVVEGNHAGYKVVAASVMTEQ